MCSYFTYKDSKSTRKIKGKTVYHNNYKESEIRAFLNGYEFISYDNSINEIYKEKGFLQKAFSYSAREKIKITIVDNSAESTGEYPGYYLKPAKEWACENTNDKIFLLSEYEATTMTDFGSYDSQCKARIRQSTDYAKATGTDVYKNGAQW